MADKYASFAELVLNEPPDAYSIRWRRTESTIAVIAPHGGAIEPGTTEVALAIAGADLIYYVFEGQKVTGNSALHITSTKFDEPICCQLIATAHFVLAIHGERSEDPVAYLGGRDSTLAGAIAVTLRVEQFNVQTPAVAGNRADEHRQPRPARGGRSVRAFPWTTATILLRTQWSGSDSAHSETR